MKDVQQVKIVAQGLGPFHREEKRDSTCDPGLFDFRKCFAERESRRGFQFRPEQGHLIERDAQ